MRHASLRKLTEFAGLGAPDGIAPPLPSEHHASEIAEPSLF